MSYFLITLFLNLQLCRLLVFKNHTDQKLKKHKDLETGVAQESFEL